MSVRKGTLPLTWKRMLSHDEAAENRGHKTTRQLLAHVRSRVPAVNLGTYYRWGRHGFDEWLVTIAARASDAPSDTVAALFSRQREAASHGR